MSGEDLVEEVKKSSTRKKRIKEALIPVSLIFIGALAAFFLWPAPDKTPSTYADADDDTVHEAQSKPSAYFNITELGIAPASYKVSLGESVGLRNKLEKEVSVSFDRSNQTVSLGPGETEKLLINGITYFEAKAKSYSATGKVNVQT
jgi:hypothetical protein